MIEITLAAVALAFAGAICLGKSGQSVDKEAHTSYDKLQTIGRLR